MKRVMAAIVDIRTNQRNRKERELEKCRISFEKKTIKSEEARQRHQNFVDSMYERECALMETCMNQSSARFAVEDVREKILALQDELEELSSERQHADSDCRAAENAMINARSNLQLSTMKQEKSLDLLRREKSSDIKKLNGVEEGEIEEIVMFSGYGTGR
ncbi:MAG: YscO family type III secretion system apparatus protein [Halopseudomonas aestusnigri]